MYKKAPRREHRNWRSNTPHNQKDALTSNWLSKMTILCVFNYITLNIVLSSLSVNVLANFLKGLFLYVHKKKLDNWISRFEASLFFLTLITFHWGAIGELCDEMSLFSRAKSTLVFVKKRQYSFALLLVSTFRGIMSHKARIMRKRDVK